MEFDPRVISYKDIVAEFFNMHHPVHSRSRQYQSAHPASLLRTLPLQLTRSLRVQAPFGTTTRSSASRLKLRRTRTRSGYA